MAGRISFITRSLIGREADQSGSNRGSLFDSKQCLAARHASAALTLGRNFPRLAACHTCCAYRSRLLEQSRSCRSRSQQLWFCMLPASCAAMRRATSFTGSLERPVLPGSEAANALLLATGHHDQAIEAFPSASLENECSLHHSYGSRILASHLLIHSSWRRMTAGCTIRFNSSIREGMGDAASGSTAGESKCLNRRQLRPAWNG